MDDNLFKKIRGRATLSFGTQYSYSGSMQKSYSQSIPPTLGKLINKVVADYNLKDNMVPNSVLINHLPKKTNNKSPPSDLPEHSDNEIEIEPNSSIYTYSVGQTRTVTFCGIHLDYTTTHTHDAIDNSLYVITRKSHSWYTHRILDVDQCEERFSITLRPWFTPKFDFIFS